MPTESRENVGRDELQSQEVAQDSFFLLALVGPGSLNNAAYSFNLGGWSVQDRSLHMEFRKEFSREFEDQEIYRAVQDLENILLALFVNDQRPRRIFYFDFLPRPEKDACLRLLFMLGQPPTTDGEADKKILTEFLASGGLIFNMRPNCDWIPSNEIIGEWFDLFGRKESLAESVSLIQKSFWTINGLYGKYQYYNFLEMCEAVVSLTSGLERLFVRESGVSFQFRVVGAAYYTAYVKENYFHNFGHGDQKFSFERMRKLLGKLYEIRSEIAHGRASKLFVAKDNKWKKLLRLLNVAERRPNDKTIFFSHILLSLGRLQKHIFAIMSSLKDNPIPKDPITILDRIVENGDSE